MNNSLQAILRQVRKKGLEEMWANHKQFQELMYSIFSIVYVPRKHVVKVWNDVVEPKFESIRSIKERCKNNCKKC